MINGIIEDNRSRVFILNALQKSHNKSKRVECIRILLSYLTQTTDVKQRSNRDLAAHTLAQIISTLGIEKEQIAADAENFLIYLIGAKDTPTTLSPHTYTHCLMYMLRINKLAQNFVSQRGFYILHKLLNSELIQQEPQIAYNVCCCFWILSYHKFALAHFQDFKLNVIEHIAKILDFYNKEKIVRMVCLIFKNLKDDEICLEHLSMINALDLVIKLKNRHWVDE